jgi:xanthine dehydrogenase accessory factor
MLDIIDKVDEWLDSGNAVALATVVQTWGSAPRGSGAKMAVTVDMDMVGSVSGGCVETAVVEAAVDTLGDGKPRLLHFGVSDDTAWEVGLTCGGKISVFVEPLSSDWWHAVTQRIRQDHPASTITILEGEAAGQKLLVDSAGSIICALGDRVESQRTSLIRAALQQTQPVQMSIDGLNIMIDTHRPRPRLIIIGGVHVAMPLQGFARQLGFRVALIDPRQVFATSERFPNVEAILHSYPDKALAQLGLDTDTYVVVLTHDPKIDDPALITALPSPAPYVGVLSSQRTHQARLQRLQAAGLEQHQLDRIHTPIGLDIGARTPEEIALCIMAEIIAVRNGVAT